MRTTSAVSSRSRVTTKTSATVSTSRKLRHYGSARQTLSPTEFSIRSPTPIYAMDTFQNIRTDQPAMHIWRAQDKSAVPVPMSDHGFFHEEGAYIVLNVGTDGECSLHYWLGKHAPQIERNTAKEKAHVLDKLLSCAEIFSKETMGHESYCFHRNFPQGIVYIEGKPKSKASQAANYMKRLYIISGRKFVRASCIEPSTDALDSRNACILDGLPRMYVWIGAKCGYTKRLKAIQVARMMRAWQRQGKAHIVVVDEKETDNHNQFVKKIQNMKLVERQRTAMSVSRCTSGVSKTVNSYASSHTSRCMSAVTKDRDLHSDTADGWCSLSEDRYSDIQSDIVLHRVTGDRVLYDMAEAARKPLQQCYLVKQDSYLLDAGPNRPIYVWVGQQVEMEDVCCALHRGQNFAKHRGYPDHIPICRIREHNEPQSFRKCFNNWRNYVTNTSQVTKCYSAGNVERNLFTRSDNRTVAKQYEHWSDDVMFDERGDTEVSVVIDNKLECLPWSQHGVFNNGNCYIIKHSSQSSHIPQTAVYYWLGEKSSIEDRQCAEQLALESAKILNYNAIVMRVLDTTEPQHFMAVLRNTIIVYDQELSTTSSKQLYCVREFTQNCIRVSQVPVKYSSMNSSAVVILLDGVDCYLWYGKASGATEREFSKNILGFLNPFRMYTYDIVTEGKESKAFFHAIGEDPGTYDSSFENKVLERRYARLVCCTGVDDNISFEDVDEFTQEDLASDEILILDTFDQIFVWCGNSRNDDWVKIPEIAKSYIEQDSAGRCLSEVDIWFVAQNAEPTVFTKHFAIWESNSYQGQASYDLTRKLLRQENVKISLDDEGFDRFITKYTFQELKQKEVPEDVDPSHRECHLKDEHFSRILKIKRGEFVRLPEWKQSQIVQSSIISQYNVITPEHS